MKNFKNVKGERVLSISHYTLKILEKCLNEGKNLNIHIGTDSQNDGNFTTYSTVIAYRWENCGVHFIYDKLKLPKIKDKIYRLQKEAKYSVETATYLNSILNVHIQIDLDFNEQKKFISSNVISYAESLIKENYYNGLITYEFPVNVKPHLQIATKAANVYCR